MSNLNRLVGVMVSAAIALAMSAPRAAFATDPTTAGGAAIGSVGNTSWAGFWKTGQGPSFSTYSVLTNGSDLFLNAPALAGTIYFRGDNKGGSNGSPTGPDGAPSRMFLDSVGMLHTTYLNNLFDATIQGTLFAHGLVVTGGTDVQGALDAFAINIVNTAQGINATGSPIVAASYSVASDRRVKRDITDFKGGLEDLQRVHPIKFKYNGLAGTGDTGQEHVGVIAQDVEAIFPSMVSSAKRKLHDNDKDLTDVKQLDPAAFTYALINAVKELSAQNKSIAAQLEDQKRLTASLRRLACDEHPEAHELCAKSVASRR